MAEIVKTVVIYNWRQCNVLYIDEFSVPTANFDLRGAIQNAAMEYHLTEEGRNCWTRDGDYDYDDFYARALEKLCPKYGFHKIRRIKISVLLDINHELLDSKQMMAVDEALIKMYMPPKNPVDQLRLQESGIQFHPKSELISEPQDDALPNQEEKENMNCMEALEESAKNPATQKKIYEIAVQFARKWGVMETLDGTLPNQGTEENMNCMLAWATEFVNNGKTDSVDFFEQKMNEVKRKEAKTEQTDN